MEPFAIILMKKDSKTGFFESEVGSYNINNYGQYIDSAYVMDIENEAIVHLRLTVNKPVKDWEYSAIYDYYDESKIEKLDFVIKIIPIEDEYEPLWEIIFELSENIEDTENMIAQLLETHHLEIVEVLEEISDKEDEYK